MGDIAIPVITQARDVAVTDEIANKIKYLAKLAYHPDLQVAAARLKAFLKNNDIKATVKVVSDRLEVYYEESVVSV